jgi:hypothetical protein
VSQLKISQAGSVQFPMVAHAAAIGWTPIPPGVAKQKRGGEAGMLFHDELEAVLARFNPWLLADAIRQLIEKLEAIPPTVEGNREMLAGCAAGGNGMTRPRSDTGTSSSSISRRQPTTPFTSPGNGH